MIKKILQLKALYITFFVLKEVEYSLDVYMRIFEEETNIDIENEHKRLEAESIKMDDEGRNPENDEKYVKDMVKLQKVSIIKRNIANDKQKIDELRKRLEIIKNDLF